MAHRVPAELQSLPNLRNQQQLALARDREQREETSRARQVDAQRALQKEIIKLQKEPLEGFRINLDDENILKWTAVIFGPPDTPYQGGYFKASLDFSRHPFWPPVIRFTPPIHHPNIHRSGMLCYQLVRPPVQGSSGSVWNVRNLLLSFLTLLIEPNPDDPANLEAAIQYRHYKEEGDPTYLHAIMANVAESRELAKRDNVIVPETNDDYTRSGIPTEQQQQSNQTEANVQEEEAQDSIAYPEDEWTNYDDDNVNYANLNLVFHIRMPVPAATDIDIHYEIRVLATEHQHNDGEEDGGLMTAVELGDAETANSNTEDEQQQPEGGPTIANRQASINSVYLHDVPRPEPTIATQASASISSVYLHDVPRPEPTIATQAIASINSVYLHDMPRPEPTIATQASASISSVYLHDMPRPEPTIATQASASISSVYLHDMPRPEPTTIANRQLSNDSVYL